MRLLKSSSQSIKLSLSQGSSLLRPFSIFPPKKPIKPSPIPNLPLIDDIVALSLKNSDLPDFQKIGIISIQHLLNTTANLFRGINTLGVKPQNTFLVGKPYSTSKSVAATIRHLGINLRPDPIMGEPGSYDRICAQQIHEMWGEFLDHLKKTHLQSIIVLDEGGHLREQMSHFVKLHYSVSSIEQTRGGLYNLMPGTLFCPLISVADSAAKTWVESPLIAQAVFSKVKALLPTLDLNEHSTFAIVGCGAIGSAIAHYLTDHGYRVIIYDEKNDALTLPMKNVFHVSTLEEVFANADCIFGCTGKDITQGIHPLELLKHNQILISCSSGDKEFKELLEHMVRDGTGFYETPLSTILGRTHSGHIIKILNGGFPINFDRTPSSVPPKDIALTRAMMLCAAIQAATLANRPMADSINKIHKFCLDPYAQKFIVCHWKKRAKGAAFISPNILKKFDSIDWIIEHSGGKYEPNSLMEQCFNIDKVSARSSFSPKSTGW